ncbi:MAG: glycosyltransferase family 4 protein [Planctomycetota bacterium]|nr:glycosyltransferase family 4 protein [Planctomycetota bacterium]
MPRILMLYHYFHPDDVAGGEMFTGLAVGLARRGWEVEAAPCNRSRHDPSRKFSPSETYEGVSIRRIWRPGFFNQSSSAGRLLNSCWMLAAWGLLALRKRRNRPDVVLTGSDPLFGVLAAWLYRKLSPGTRIAHWCFDVHPDAAVAEGTAREGSWKVRAARRALREAYACCDLVADLGPCMRARLERYGHPSLKVTLPPWAMHEPTAPAVADPETRRRLFGDARLAVLYSGHLGRAHAFHNILALARELSGDGVEFRFAVRGPGEMEIRAAAEGIPNVAPAEFAPKDRLPLQLGAADIHVASLKPGWEGLVVPSKFFGSLAAGRPVLFDGPPDSDIGRWISEHDVGWILTEDRIGETAARMRRLASDREALVPLQLRCFETYRGFFSKEKTVAQWDTLLRSLIGNRTGASAAEPTPAHR